MSEISNNFGSTGGSTGWGGSTFLSPRSRRLRLILLVLSIAVACPLLLSAFNYFYKNHFEFIVPVVNIVERPRALGSEPQRLQFVAADLLSGLSQVRVVIRQQDRQGQVKEHEILSQRLNRNPSFETVLDIFGTELGLTEETAVLEIETKDASLWNNINTVSFPLVFDNQAPKVEALTSIVQAHKGGSFLMFLRCKDVNLERCGIRVGEKTFIAAPARTIDSELSANDLYTTLVAAPKESNAKIEAFAEDISGNVSTTPLLAPSLLEPEKYENIQVPEDISKAALKTVLARKQQVLSSVSSDAATALQINTPAEILQFLAAADEAKIRKVLVMQRLERAWESRLSQPVGPPRNIEFASQTWPLGDGQSYQNHTDKGVHYYSSRSDQDVQAALEGQVLFSENLATLGNTIIIDHGLGLATVYTNVEQPKVKQGQRIMRDQVIAKLGTSGLAHKPEVYFQVRIQGEPVEPLNWFDSTWYGMAIAGRVYEAKKALGLAGMLSNSQVPF